MLQQLGEDRGPPAVQGQPVRGSEVRGTATAHQAAEGNGVR